MTTQSEILYQDPYIADGSWKEIIKNTCLSKMLTFDLYSLGVVLFELFTGLCFCRSVYGFEEVTVMTYAQSR